MQHDREQFASSCMCVSLLVLVWLVVGVWPDPVYIAVKVSDGKIDGLRAQLKTLQDLVELDIKLHQLDNAPRRRGAACGEIMPSSHAPISRADTAIMYAFAATRNATYALMF